MPPKSEKSKAGPKSTGPKSVKSKKGDDAKSIASKKNSFVEEKPADAEEAKATEPIQKKSSSDFGIRRRLELKSDYEFFFICNPLDVDILSCEQ